MVVATGILAAAIRGVVEWLLQRGWTWPALAFVLLVGVAWAILFGLVDRDHLRNPEGRILPLPAMGFVVGSALVWVYIFAGLSYGLARVGAVQYTVARRPEELLAFLTDAYTWHLLDLVPGLKITTTMGWTSPIDLDGGARGALLVLFRAVVIYQVVAKGRQFLNPDPPAGPAAGFKVAVDDKPPRRDAGIQPRGGVLPMPLTEDQERLEAVGDQLRAKISSKFAASTFLAGFAATILAGLISTLWQPDNAAPVHFPKALGAAMAGAILFILGIIRLDELSMPKRFWPSSSGALRPGGDVGLLTMEDLWALHDRMVFFWRYLTLAGTALTGLAILLLIVPQDYARSGFLRSATFWWAGAGAAAAFTYGRWRDKRAPHRDKLVRPVD